MSHRTKFQENSQRAAELLQLFLCIIFKPTLPT